MSARNEVAGWLRANKATVLEAAKAQVARAIEERDPPGPNALYLAAYDAVDDAVYDALCAAIDDLDDDDAT